MNFITYFLVVHFLCVSKENEPKEKTANHLFRFQRNHLCCSQKADASGSRTPLGVFIPLAGYSAESFSAF